MKIYLINSLRKFTKKILPKFLIKKIKVYLYKKKEKKEIRILNDINSKFKILVI